MDSEGLLTAAHPTIQRHERREMRVYKDPLGVPTIGEGINMLDSDVPRLCANCGANYDRLLSGADALTGAQADYLYEQKAIQTVEWLTKLFPAFFTYTQPRQIALLDMGYNLGEPKFRQFRMMISAILEGNWAEAAAQALHSLWADEVKGRAVEDAHALVEG